MRKGEKMSAEQRAKIAAAQTGRKLSPERREQCRLASLGRKQTPEEIERRRAANAGRKRTPEFCDQMRQLQARRTPEQRAAHAERMRKFNSDAVRKENNRQRLIARNKARKGTKLAFSPVRAAVSNDPVFYVYEHWRTDKGQCFYVGKGFGKRANDMRNRNRWHKFLQQYLSKNGYGLEVRIIQTGLTERQAFDLEMQRIAFWKNDGCDLVNVTVGGDGPTGRKHTEEWKRQLSAKMKGRKMSAESRAKLSAALKGNTNGRGAKRAPHLVEKLAAFNRGKHRSPEVKAKLSAIRHANPTFKGKTHSTEWRAMMSALQTGKPKPEWVKAKMRKPKSPEHREKIRAIRLAAPKASAETRAKIAENSRIMWTRRKAATQTEE